jgi:hypothetical protein
MALVVAPRRSVMVCTIVSDATRCLMPQNRFGHLAPGMVPSRVDAGASMADSMGAVRTSGG